MRSTKEYIPCKGLGSFEGLIYAKLNLSQCRRNEFDAQ